MSKYKLVGDEVKCDRCGKVYKFFIWSLGSDVCLCRQCVLSRPSAYLDNIDRVDYRPPNHMTVEEEIEQEEARETFEAMRWSYRRFKRTVAATVQDKPLERQ